jgi:8-oxo-dGTP pyrophosphatase MutT (NUDIX family)/transcriptional regulator with XRE-family HTH domain
VRVEEVVGWQVHERREALGLTQEQLGRQLEPLLGRPWSRQAVSAAEKGDRSFGAAELVALAAVLHATVGDLLRPPVKEAAVDLGGPDMVPRDMLLAVITARLREDMNLPAIHETLDVLADSLARSQENDARAVKAAQDLDMLITERVSAGGVIRAPLASAGTGPAAFGLGAAQRSEPDKRPPIVAAIVTSPLGVLVGRRVDGKPPWTFIAGEQDAVKDENPADTAVREVKEETGLRIVAGELIGERVHPKTGRTMIYLTAKPTHGTDIFVGDEDELAEVRWVGLAEADELLSGMFEPVREHLARELGEA